MFIFFYFIFFYFILFYFNLFYFILFYFILFYFILFYLVKADGKIEEEAAVLFAAHMKLKEQLSILQKVSDVTCCPDHRPLKILYLLISPHIKSL